MTNFKYKIMNGTCPGTSKRTAKGQHRDTNNNDNNILFNYLFNKYKEQFSVFQNREEKQAMFNVIMQDIDFKKLTKEKQTELYTRLLSVV